MRCVLPLVLLSLGFTPAPVPKPKAAEEDLKRMQGFWVLAFIVKDGEREDMEEKLTWEIKGNRVSTMEDGKEFPPFFIALDAKPTPGPSTFATRKKKGHFFSVARRLKDSRCPSW